MTMFSLNKTGATIMTTTGTTTRLSDGARLPRVRSGLHLNHNLTAVSARKPQVKAALTSDDNSTRVCAATAR